MRTLFNVACIATLSLMVTLPVFAQEREIQAAEQSTSLSPFAAALKQGASGNVREMIAGGADVNASFENGSYPITVAAQSGNMEMIKILTAQGAKTSVVDAQGRSAVHYAAASGNIDILKYMLAFGAQADVPDSDNMTPLYHAYHNGHMAIAEYLVSAERAKVNRTDKDGYLLAFEIVKKEDRPDIIQHMVNNGLNIFKRDKQDLRLGDVAQVHGHMQSYHILNDAYQRKIQEFYNRLTNEGGGAIPGGAPF